MRRPMIVQDVWAKRLKRQDERSHPQADTPASQAEVMAAYARTGKILAHTCSDPLDPLAYVRLA